MATSLARGVAALTAGLSLLVGGTGCGERAEPTGALVPLFPVTVRGAGERGVTVREPPRRIAVLAGAPARILRRLGAGSRIVGAPGGRATRVVTPTGNVLLGALRRLKPDLLVASTATDPAQLREVANAIHAPVYVAPGDSLREVELAITELGLLAGKPVAARRIVGGIETRRRRVARRLAGRRPVRVFVDVGFFTTVGDATLIGDLIREARGRNVAGRRAAPGPLDLDQLARLDPQVYVATSDSGTTLRDLRANRKTRRMQAVRTRRFGVVRDEYLQPDPLVGRGLEELARILHPRAFR